jgi:hypothetical protein
LLHHELPGRRQDRPVRDVRNATWLPDHPWLAGCARLGPVAARGTAPLTCPTAFLEGRPFLIGELVGPCAQRLHCTDRHRPAAWIRLAELREAGESLAASWASLRADQWQRVGVYNWPAPAARSMAWLARHTVHEGVHHLHDIARGIERLRGRQPPVE